MESRSVDILALYIETTIWFGEYSLVDGKDL